MLSILFLLFIVITASSPLWVTIFLMVIGAKHTESSDLADESDDSDDDFYSVAAICD